MFGRVRLANELGVSQKKKKVPVWLSKSTSNLLEPKELGGMMKVYGLATGMGWREGDEIEMRVVTDKIFFLIGKVHVVDW